MKKVSDGGGAGGEVATEVTDFPLSLDEFCARLSSTDSRVELIGGFYHVEALAGNNQDVESKFHERFVAFVSAPIV